ncbi:MAG: hypothetical protein FJ027_09635 [Candidatus Rokubacteria bacterium]|nr:hypothetical protein [Candidatus Rokubacteria bacterium]
MRGMTFGTLALITMLAGTGLATAQTNTTGTIGPNTSVAQTPPTTAPGVGTTTNGTTTTPGGTTTGGATPTVAAPAVLREAVIVVCGEDISTGATRLVVFSASSSAGAPTIAPASPCAQALADLFVAGFGLMDVQPFNQQLQYTLVR